MSLTKFITIPDVVTKIKPFRPKPPRRIKTPLKVEPHSTRHMLVGTAFDYFLRFELHRRAPHAETRRWIAEAAPDRIWWETEQGAGGVDLLGNPTQKNWLPPYEVANRARRIIEEAKKAVAAYIKSRAPSNTQQTALASHAIRLAKLDAVTRALQLDPQFAIAEPEDVQDLLAMLALVPFEVLPHKKVMHLNPTFGESSALVGGADTDLIAGDRLIDFETTKSNELQLRDPDQLFGYFLLARAQHRTNPKFPNINKIGLYLCRHAYLWTIDTTEWTKHPQFAEIEEWFFKRAKEVFSGREQRQCL